MFFFRENMRISEHKMDDDWGYPYFRKPPIDKPPKILAIRMIEGKTLSWRCRLSALMAFC
jgi:hypothetical protein